MIANIQFTDGSIFRAEHTQLGLMPYEVILYHNLRMDVTKEYIIDKRAAMLAYHLKQRQSGNA